MGRKLLVADDSVTIQKVIKLALSSEGYDILAVSDGREAIRAVQEERPDVVLIDVALPGADAYQVKRAINNDPKLAHIGFILLASAFERVDEKTVDEVGFQGRLIKPFDPSHLRKAVADLMSNMGSSAGKPATAAPPPPPVSIETEEEEPLTHGGEGDLPPVSDGHPTLSDEPSQPKITEAEFAFDTPTIAIEPPVVAAPPPAPPAPPSPPQVAGDETEQADEVAATRALENDIKDLTESTIKMSGLDEYDWSLDDSKKMKSSTAAPAAPKAPPAPPAPEGASEFSHSERTVELPRPKNGPSIRNVITIPSKPIDDGGSNFPLKHTHGVGGAGRGSQPPTSTPPPSEPTENEYVPPTIEIKPPAAQTPEIKLETRTPSRAPTGPTYSPPPSGASVAPPITRAEIEALIRKDVEAVIERLARELVPQIAENVIRKEIEKILSET